ncbi:MAG: hypothetical protein ACQR33_06075 [Candidatus Saccharibacteria bacterium]
MLALGFPEIVILIVLSAILAFELWMLMAIWQSEKLSGEAKVLWTVAMLVFHPFVALYYYFTFYRDTE